MGWYMLTLALLAIGVLVLSAFLELQLVKWQHRCIRALKEKHRVTQSEE